MHDRGAGAHWHRASQGPTWLAEDRRAIARLPAEGVPADFGDRSVERVTAEQLRPQLAATLAALSRQDRELLLLVAWVDLT